MPAKPRKKPPPQTTSDSLFILETAIGELAYGHHTFTVFRHFVGWTIPPICFCYTLLRYLHYGGVAWGHAHFL